MEILGVLLAGTAGLAALEAFRQKRKSEQKRKEAEKIPDSVKEHLAKQGIRPRGSWRK